MRKYMQRSISAFVAGAFVAMLVHGAAAVAQLESWPQLYNVIQQGSSSIFDDVVILKSSDIFDPHDPDYGFNIDHFAERLDVKAPLGTEHKLLLLDVEVQLYPDGNRVNHVNPRDFQTAITAVQELRPLHVSGMDGGLSTDWRLLLKDEFGEYRYHHLWVNDAQRWRPTIEQAHFWTSSHYRDTKGQAKWRERLRVFVDLFRQEFPDKPLGIYIWHRERTDRNGSTQWISMRDYVEMGLYAQSLGCTVFAFGREDNPDNYDRAMRYFQTLQDHWN